MPAVARAGRRHLGGPCGAVPPHPFEGALLGGAGPANRRCTKPACRTGRAPASSGGATRGGRVSGTKSRRTATTRSLAATPGPWTGSDLDASLLTLPLYGYADAAGSPRMRSTVRRTLVDDLGWWTDWSTGTIRSTPDGLPPGEGAFGICSFWALECPGSLWQGRSRRGDSGRSNGSSACRNDVGLLA